MKKAPKFLHGLKAIQTCCRKSSKIIVAYLLTFTMIFSVFFGTNVFALVDSANPPANEPTSYSDYTPNGDVARELESIVPQAVLDTPSIAFFREPAMDEPTDSPLATKRDIQSTNKLSLRREGQRMSEAAFAGRLTVTLPDTPEHTIVWIGVPGAVAYTIYIDGQPRHTISADSFASGVRTFNLSWLLLPYGVYDVNLRAIAAEPDVNSALSNTLIYVVGSLRIFVMPSWTSIESGGQQQFAIEAFIWEFFGHPELAGRLTDVISWTTTQGTITEEGLFTAPTLEYPADFATATIRATIDNAKINVTASDWTSAAVIVPVTSVTIAPSTLNLVAGTYGVLNATFTPSNATDRFVWWDTSNAEVATVNHMGVVTAVSEGSATITATAIDGGFTATATVNVSAAPVGVTGVTVEPDTLDLVVGGTSNLDVTVAPANATDQRVTFESDDISVATVNADGSVTAVAPGSATITVTTVDGEHTAYVEVNVSAAIVAVTGITVAPTTLSLAMGGTSTLGATVAPANATNQAVVWSTSNAAVATVSQGGVVTAVAPGSATITVTTADGGFTASSAVNVSAATISVTGVTVTPTTLTLAVGNTSTLGATVAPANATNQAVTWSTSNAAVATVNANGAVVAVAPGTATITVTTVDGDHIATATITVTEPPVQRPPSGGGGGGGGGGGFAAPRPPAPRPPAEEATDATDEASDEDGTDEVGTTLVMPIPEGSDSVRIENAKLSSLVTTRTELVIQQGIVNVVLPLEFVTELSLLDEDFDIYINETLGTGATFATAAISFYADGDEVSDFNNTYYITINLESFDLDDIRINRIVAIIDSQNFPGVFNPRTRLFTVDGIEDGVTVTFAYVPSFNILTLQVGQNIMRDLDGPITMDIAPIIEASRMLVPIRFIAEGLGAVVTWDQATQTATFELEGQTLSLTINELQEGMEVPARILENRTVVPVRFIADFFGARVYWDGTDGIATIIN